MCGLCQRLSQINWTAPGLAEPGEQHRDGRHTSSGSAEMGPTAPGTMTKPGLAGSSTPVAFNTNPRLPLDTGRGSFGGNQFHRQFASDGVTTRREDFERGDDVERVEAVEQHESGHACGHRGGIDCICG